MSAENEMLCGKCQHFRLNGANQKPVGTKKLETGEEVALGYCKAPPAGLLLGVRDETDPCIHPLRPFTPKDPAKQ